MFKFLERELPTKYILFFAPLFTCIYLIWCAVVVMILRWFEVPLREMSAYTLNPLMWQTWVMVLFAVIGEEVVFRAPITIAVKGLGLKLALLLFALPACIVFGYLHGDSTNLLIQGFAGLIFILVYLKFGGAKGKFWKPFGCAVLVHLLINVTLLIMDLVHRIYMLS